jgi:hypothetical protein
MTEDDIGMVVHYVARGSLDGVYKPVCRAAMVTAIGEEYDQGVETLSLCVINPEGQYFNRNVDHDEAQAPGTWHFRKKGR